MTKGFQITKVEIKRRFGYILLGVFAGLGVIPLREWFVETVPISPLWICGIGILATLYFFDFS